MDGANVSPAVEIAIALSDGGALGRLPPADDAAAVLAALGWRDPPAVELVRRRPVAGIHLGNEFCETLIPAARTVVAALAVGAAMGTRLALATPVVADAGLARLAALLPLLPAGSEVVANDWGVMALLHESFPALRPVAGRLLCKMVKDPRLPSAQWARLYPHGIFAAPFRAVLDRFGVRRVELDVPPFAAAEDFRGDGLAVSVHVPFGFAVKGRTCRIGSLHLADTEKFAAGHRCRKECLSHVGVMARPDGAGATDLSTFQRGTAVFYNHSVEMAQAVVAAVARGWVDRIIVAGDWNADHGAGQPA